MRESNQHNEFIRSTQVSSDPVGNPVTLPTQFVKSLQMLPRQCLKLGVDPILQRHLKLQENVKVSLTSSCWKSIAPIRNRRISYWRNVLLQAPQYHGIIFFVYHFSRHLDETYEKTYVQDWGDLSRCSQAALCPRMSLAGLEFNSFAFRETLCTTWHKRRAAMGTTPTAPATVTFGNFLIPEIDSP